MGTGNSLTLLPIRVLHLLKHPVTSLLRPILPSTLLLTLFLFMTKV